MFDIKKLNPANIKPEDIPEDRILEAFDKLQEYCQENSINMKDFISDDQNIAKASEIIHGKLNIAQRAILSKKKIHSLIETHIDFIRNKVNELSDVKTAKNEQSKAAIKDLDDLF